MTVATNIRLPEELLKTLKHKAVEENKSVNRLICDAIELSLTMVPQNTKQSGDSFDKIIGAAKSGCKDGSAHHDRYLYGKKR
jgi:hypothetical protein